jgi:regulatory protein YycI of two-component signal transduction system YycFG
MNRTTIFSYALMFTKNLFIVVLLLLVVFAMVNGFK